MLFAGNFQSPKAPTENYKHFVNAEFFGNPQLFAEPAKIRDASIERYENDVDAGSTENAPMFVAPAKTQEGKSSSGQANSSTRSTKNKRPATRPLARSLAKTKLCRFFAVGACRNAIRGVDCPFAHSEQEHAAQPDLRKTRLCHDFEHNCCKLSASQCPFAHGIDDLKVSNSEEKAVIKEHLRNIVAMFGPPHENLAQQPTNAEAWLGAEVASPKIDSSAWLEQPVDAPALS